MIQSVPFASIIAMTVNAVIVTLIPITAFIYLNKKVKCNQNCVLIGAGTFIVFALILESLLHQIVFHFFGGALTGNTWFYALYGGLAAGLFEETGRYISMKLFMKKSLTKQNSLMFGIGHGGAEAILIAAMSAFSNIVMSVMINAGQVDKLLALAGEGEKEIAIQQLSALSETPPHEFLLSTAERLFAFVLQICLSYIVYRAVRYKKPLFWVLAVVIHFAVDASVTVLVKKIPIYCIEIILAVETVCLALTVYKAYKAEIEEVNTAAGETI
ncbi:MAG: YhfC family intramembrane metalloprotease [Ruminococcaceae bacterium]|nr:YhfC family intramembrane metalloprotease [Oscillospiraceae bacterium]